MTSTEITELLSNANLFNETVMVNMLRANQIISAHDNIVVSVSGGSDSDIMMDIVERVKGDKQVRYVWFDTGVEYQATKDHIDYLEKRYGVTIEKYKAVKPIPMCCKEYGVPFLSKYISKTIEILQRHNFKWEDKPYSELIKEYPKIKCAIRWWCNDFEVTGKYKSTTFNINRRRYLKEFLIANPPDFKISSKCCTYAKKKVAKGILKQENVDLEVVGTRKAEGGLRSHVYKNCFTDNGGGGRPVQTAVLLH